MKTQRKGNGQLHGLEVKTRHESFIHDETKDRFMDRASHIDPLSMHHAMSEIAQGMAAARSTSVCLPLERATELAIFHRGNAPWQAVSKRSEWTWILVETQAHVLNPDPFRKRMPEDIGVDDANGVPARP